MQITSDSDVERSMFFASHDISVSHWELYRVIDSDIHQNDGPIIYIDRSFKWFALL